MLGYCLPKALIVGEIPMVRAFSNAFKHSCGFMLSTYRFVWSNENLNSTCTLKNDLYDDFEE